MLTRYHSLLFALIVILFHAPHVGAFQENGCGAGDCRDCHTLNKKEAAALLSIGEDSIIDLQLAQVPGLWEVDVRQQEKVIPVYIDFSKQYLLSGSVIKIADKQDITKERFADLNRIDVSVIPMDDALVVGDTAARHKIIVFDDPECPYCAKLQEEMKKVIGQRPDIAFLIKMFPLKSHPNAYAKAKAIVCAKSLEMLEASLAGKPLGPPSCEADQVEKNIALADSIGIRSTPTMIFPDGRVLPGYKPGEEIIRLLDNPSTHTTEAK
ncbi:MAG: DsbC family protein [Desulfobulbales bacterium]